ncbi:uncharacterized protein METZ01_LOCUS8907 [marine metagenome]|uniref:FlgD/Vpr Ig-like domain-containing protein n=1 Tax=marine metagenome TaxID=408172 RepID=A0A381NRD6_9ZZZZ
MNMQSIFHRYLAFIAALSLMTALSGQSIMEFIGEWTGTESLFSQVETYDSKDILVNIADGGDREGFLIYESSSTVIYNEELSWAYHYFSYDKDEIQVLFLRRFITPIGVLGSQELRYSILEWTGNSMVLNHVSHDGDLTHKMTLNRAALDVDHMQPGLLSLKANYPNPFNPVTTITVESENESFGDLSIFNLQGQWVRTLYSGSFHPGQSTYRWHGIDHRGNPVSSGTYLYRLRVNGRVISRKMVLFK